MSDDDLANVATVSAGNNEVVRACARPWPLLRFLGPEHGMGQRCDRLRLVVIVFIS